MSEIRRRGLGQSYQLRLNKLGVRVETVRCLDHLKSNLNQRPGPVPDGDELPQRDLQDGLELPLSSTYTGKRDLSTRPVRFCALRIPKRRTSNTRSWSHDDVHQSFKGVLVSPLRLEGAIHGCGDGIARV